MFFRFLFFFFYFLLATQGTMARQTDLKREIEQMEHANSKERIRLFCIFFDDHIYNKTPDRFDTMLAACYRIAEKEEDKAFISYLNFYKRIKTVMLIPDLEVYAREAKILKILEKSLLHYQAINDEYFTALAHAYIGHAFFMVKDYANSIEHWLKANEGFQKFGYQRFPDIGKHLHNMALVFYFFRNYKTVAELMEKAVRLPSYGRNYAIQRYNTLGAAYTHLKQYKKGETAFKETIRTAVFYTDSLWIAIASKGLAKLYLDEGKYQKAFYLYKSTLPMIKKINAASGNTLSREYSEHLLGLAKTSVLLNDFSGARYYLNQINYQKNSNTKEQLFSFGVTYQDINYWLDFYDVQHRYHYAIKNYERSYHYKDSLYAVKYQIDSMFNRLEVQVAAHHVEVQKKQHQSDTKEATIQSKNRQMVLIGSLLAVIAIASVLLFRKNRQVQVRNKIISSQLSELTKTLEQKQVLLSELQHRVKNNLQHVISILELQKESIAFNSIEELIRGNQNRIHSMALLHKKLNISDHVNEVDVRRYVHELSQLVKDSYDDPQKAITLQVNCEVACLSIEKTLPIGLIVVELVSNSMKHAFKNRSSGMITIEITSEQQTVKLDYADNGMGFDFNKTSDRGLGQEIIKGLIDQLDGTYETNSEEGFEITVSFDISGMTSFD